MSSNRFTSQRRTTKLVFTPLINVKKDASKGNIKLKVEGVKVGNDAAKIDVPDMSSFDFDMF